MSHEKNYQSMFFNAFHETGWNEEEVEKIYALAMDMEAFFDFQGIVPPSLRLQYKEKSSLSKQNERFTGKMALTYYWKSESTEAVCPKCGMVSAHPCNDYDCKPVQDIPRDNMAVFHEVTFKRYFCDNPSCEATRFVERFPEFSEEKARKTVRLKQYFIQRALGSSANHAEGELRAEGAIVCNDTIMHYLKEASSRQIHENRNCEDVKVIAVDDVNLRKGDKSSGCTVFVDAETHKALLIVWGTTKEVAAEVLRGFKNAEFMTRDRASALSAAGNACELKQVADRFHLLKNAHDMIKETLMSTIPVDVFYRTGDGWKTRGQGDDEKSEKYFYVPDDLVERKIKLSGVSESKANKYRKTLKILELSSQGFKSSEISQKLDISLRELQTLRRNAVSTLEYVHARIQVRIDQANKGSQSETRTEAPGGRVTKTVSSPGCRPANNSIVEPYRDIVVQEWKVGGNHRTIFTMLCDMGYTGSKNAIYQYILKLQKENPDVMVREKTKQSARKSWEKDFDTQMAASLPDVKLEKISRDRVYRQILHEASETRPEGEKTKKKTESTPLAYENSRTSLRKEDWETIYGAKAKAEQERKQLTETEKQALVEKKTHSSPT